MSCCSNDNLKTINIDYCGHAVKNICEIPTCAHKLGTKMLDISTGKVYEWNSGWIVLKKKCSFYFFDEPRHTIWFSCNNVITLLTGKNLYDCKKGIYYKYCSKGWVKNSKKNCDNSCSKSSSSCSSSSSSKCKPKRAKCIKCPKGERGPQGPKGDQGDTGTPFNISAKLPHQVLTLDSFDVNLGNGWITTSPFYNNSVQTGSVDFNVTNGTYAITESGKYSIKTTVNYYTGSAVNAGSPQVGLEPTDFFNGVAPYITLNLQLPSGPANEVARGIFPAIDTIAAVSGELVTEPITGVPLDLNLVLEQSLTGTLDGSIVVDLNGALFSEVGGSIDLDLNATVATTVGGTVTVVVPGNTILGTVGGTLGLIITATAVSNLNGTVSATITSATIQNAITGSAQVFITGTVTSTLTGLEDLIPTGDISEIGLTGTPVVTIQPTLDLSDLADVVISGLEDIELDISAITTAISGTVTLLIATITALFPPPIGIPAALAGLIAALTAQIASLPTDLIVPLSGLILDLNILEILESVVLTPVSIGIGSLDVTQPVFTGTGLLNTEDVEITNVVSLTGTTNLVGITVTSTLLGLTGFFTSATGAIPTLVTLSPPAFNLTGLVVTSPLGGLILSGAATGLTASSTLNIISNTADISALTVTTTATPLTIDLDVDVTVTGTTDVAATATANIGSIPVVAIQELSTTINTILAQGQVNINTDLEIIVPEGGQALLNLHYHQGSYPGDVHLGFVPGLGAPRPSGVLWAVHKID